MLHPRTLSLALLATAALGVAGCGGDDSGGGDDEAQVREVVSDYAAAIADSDGDKACGYLTNDARTQVEAAGKALDVDGGCAEVMEKATAQASDDERKQLENIEITSVEINGDRAVVQVTADGEKGDPSTMVKEDGEWRIAADREPGTATAERPSAATVTLSSTTP
jgi:ketosteroid isomerase-like protein